MPIDDQELRAIQFLAQRIRRATPGAAPWDDDGLFANLRKLQTRNLHMTVEHVLRHAADPKAKNPGVLAGNFTPEAPTSTGRAHPPKRADQCTQHPGWWRDNCGGCRVDALADDTEATPPPVAWQPGNAQAGADAARIAAGLAPKHQESA